MKKLKRKNTLTSNYNGPVKIGSNVMILSGDYKKKTGKVMDFDRKRGLVKVENCAMRTHFIKSKDNGGHGGLVKQESWMPIAKVKYLNDTEEVTKEEVNENN